MDELNLELDRAVAAIKAGDDATLEKVLENAQNLEQLLVARISDRNVTNHAIGFDATLLQLASFRSWNQGNACEVLLRYGAEIDLHSACGLGRIDVIEENLSAEASRLQGQIDTYFPLQYAITATRPEAIDCLMRYGDDANRDLEKVAYFGWENEVVGSNYQPWKPIHMASLWGFSAERIPVAESLQNHGADLNAVSPLDGFRPIHLVAMPNRVDMIRFFVTNGVEVDSRSEECHMIRLGKENDGPMGNPEGSQPGPSFEVTPLMVACGEGFAEATECLLDLGADPNARDSWGQTPLHFATKRFWDGQPYQQVIDLLVARGADRMAKDDEGRVPAV